MPPSESARERELYKFYTPWIDVSSLSHVPADQFERRSQGDQVQSSRDKTLTAFAQLATLRLNVKRGMVSLIDSTTQIILAEATRSLSLVDDNRHAPDDQIWLGNISFPRADAVCYHTFSSNYTAKDPDGREHEAAALIVPDLREDERFSQKGYVTREGGVKFYAGVPITTRGGSQIGVYAVSDDRPRAGLTVDELMFMQDMAVTVLEHLEMVKSRHDRDRGERMVRGLASFIERLSTLKHQADQPTHDGHELVEPTWHSGKDTTPLHVASDDADKHMNDSVTVQNVTQEEEASAHDSDEIGSVSTDFTDPVGKSRARDTTSSLGDVPASDIKQIFARASRTLRKCTKTDGCVFFDASAGGFDDEEMHLDHPQSPEHHNRRGSSSSSEHEYHRKVYNKAERKQKSQPSQIIGLSLKDHRPNAASEIALPEYVLRKCLHRYPRGRIFSFDEDGGFSSGDDTMSEDNLTRTGKLDDVDKQSRARRKRKKGPRTFVPSDLLKILPGVRTAIFLPLYDYPNNRWFAGCFIWTARRGGISDTDVMPYMKAFGSCIMSEVASMEALHTNRAKTTFIASISHELRSPLHGILGSLEFLEDTMTTAYQMGLVGSIETCGKTLLDTIDHLLDHAKINNLTKTVSRQSSSASLRSSKRNSAELSGTMNSITAEFDLACLVEDVLEAVFAGQTFRRAKPRGHPGESAARQAMDQMHDLSLDDSLSQEEVISIGNDKFSGRVVVVLNIAKSAALWVRGQAGGLRRVVMNLFGNSIKYCESGAIEASLSVKSVNKSTLGFEFVVKDTGRGMSKEFMSKQLFRPFSQEDSFSYGTGLGLSIVKQIIDSMSGKIEFQSQKGVGTEILVSATLPLACNVFRDLEDTLLEEALNITRGKKMCLLHPAGEDRTKDTETRLLTLSASMARTCKDWFDMTFLESSTVDADAEIFFYAEPPPIEYLLEHHSERRAAGKDGREVALLIVCTNAFEAASLRAAGVNNLVSLGRVIEVISQPVGPRKLAKVLMQCLRRVEELNGGPTPAHDDKETKPFSRAMQASDEAKHAVRQMDWTASDVVYDENLGKHRPSIAKFKWRSDPPPGGLNSGNTEDDTPSASGSEGDKSDRRHDRVTQGLSGRNEIGEKGTDTPVPPKVLLVDDNPINLKLLLTFMKKINLPHEEAVNGLDALEKYKASKRPFDYVLMDISMPVMDGITSTRKIREFERDTNAKPSTIIALTGLASGSTQEEAFAAGISHFLAKPVRFKALQQLLIPKP